MSRAWSGRLTPHPVTSFVVLHVSFALALMVPFKSTEKFSFQSKSLQLFLHFSNFPCHQSRASDDDVWVHDKASVGPRSFADPNAPLSNKLHY